MGTPEFAVASLEQLLEEGFQVVGVVTAPDKPGGRGNKTLIQSPVKLYALEHGLPFLQPEKLRSPEFLSALKAWNADVQLVVAFRMLPEVVWNMPRLGTFNVHGSLLPKYRGAAPIHWAVINGESETGVTTFKLKHDIDTGDWVMQERLQIGPDETTGSVYNRLMQLGAGTLVKTVRLLESGMLSFHPQSDQEATHAPKLTTENTEIDWNSSAKSIHNFIRGLNPLPTAWTWFNEEKIKVFSSRLGGQPTGQQQELPPFVIADRRLWAKVSDGWLEILEIQPAGRKRMDAAAFLNGFSQK